jgi:uncharacterized membrane protein YdcZ (DUF606 family)
VTVQEREQIRVPWYVWLGGYAGVATYIMTKMTYLRVGDYTYVNAIPMSGP